MTLLWNMKVLDVMVEGYDFIITCTDVFALYLEIITQGTSNQIVLAMVSKEIWNIGQGYETSKHLANKVVLNSFGK